MRESFGNSSRESFGLQLVGVDVLFITMQLQACCGKINLYFENEEMRSTSECGRNSNTRKAYLVGFGNNKQQFYSKFLISLEMLCGTTLMGDKNADLLEKLFGRP